MKTTKTKPEGLVDFDLDLHLHIVNEFMTKNEEVLYSFNHDVGADMRKSDGIRMTFDIIQVRSLIHAERTSLFLSYGPSMAGMELPMNTKREIAGVLGDELWFEGNDEFFSADEELRERKASYDAVSAPLKSALSEFQRAMAQMFKEFKKEQRDGEEWKE
jgi:hypothetical protein